MAVKQIVKRLLILAHRPSGTATSARAPPPRRSLRGRLLCSGFLEYHKVILLKQLEFLADLLEAGFNNLGFKDLLASSNMIQHPIGADAGNPAKVDENDAPARLERPLDRCHCLEGKLEMMVRVADEGDVDGFRWQLLRVDRREQRVDVSLHRLATGRLNVIEERLRYVDGDHAAILPDRLREEMREQASPRTDVGDGLSRLDLASAD